MRLMHLEWTPSEQARHVRAELEAIAASLRLLELEELLIHGRALLERATCPSGPEPRPTTSRSRPR